MIKKFTILSLLAILSLTGCTQSGGNNTPSGEGTPSGEPVDPSGGDVDPSGGDVDPSGGEDPVTPPSGPTKVEIAKHTLSDGNPPIDINSIGQHVNKSTWNSFKGASASKFTNNYNYTFRYFVSGQVTYETFTKNGYELSNSSGIHYYERIDNKLYYYNSVSDGYERISSSYDFISHRSEVLAHEVYVHMFEYENYTYYGEDEGMDGSFIYNTSAFSNEIKFQGGYLTYLRYTLNSPLTTYEIHLSFESTIEIPKSYYYKS